MRTVEVVFAAGWTLFWIYWLIAAFSMKKGHVPWSRHLGVAVMVSTATGLRNSCVWCLNM